MPGWIFSIRVGLLILILLAVIPGVGLSIYNAQEQRIQDAAAAQREALTQVRFASSRQEQLVAETRQLLSFLARQPEVQRGDAATCSAYLADTVEQYVSYTSLFVAALNGDIYCSSVPLPEPLSVAGWPHFQEATETRELSIGNYRVGQVLGRAVLGFRYPVIDQEGSLRGVVFAGLDLAWLNQFIADIDLPPGSSLSIIDRNGTVLARYPGPGVWVGRPVADRPLFAEMVLAEGDGTGDAVGLDSIPKLYAFTRLGGPPHSGEIYVSIGIPKSVAYAPTERALRRHLIGLGVALSLTLAIAWFGTDIFMMRRVRALVTATQRLASGHLNYRSGLKHGAGEFGRLAQAFDQMAQGLEAHEEERSARIREQARRAEAEAAQERITSILEGISDAFFALDNQWRFTYVNDRAMQVVRRFNPLAPEDLIGKDIRKEVPSTVDSRLHQEGGRALAEQTPTHFEEFIPLLDSWFEFHLYPSMEGLSVFFRDITDRKWVEEAERRFAEENEALAEIGRIVSSSLDVSQVFEGFAQQVRRLIPFDRISIVLVNSQDSTVTTAYALGHEVPGLEAGSTRPLRGSPTEQVMVARRGLLFQGEEQERLLRLAPSAAHAIQAGLDSMIIVPLISQDQVIGALVLRSLQSDCYSLHHVDLAERIGLQIGGAIASAQLYASLTAAEYEAQGERQRLHSVLETAPVGIFVVDAEQKVVFANQEMERILGFTHRPGEPLDQYIPAVASVRRPDGAEYGVAEWPLQRALAEGERVRAEEVHVAVRDGRRVPALANATPILAADGVIIGGILALQDMSALEQAQNARREFLGVVSHEMRTPLTIIKGSAATALNSEASIDPAEARALFEIIDDEADRLKDLIDDLLDINRIESGTLSVQLEPLDLKTVLERAQANYARTGSAHRLLIQAPDGLPLVMGDQDRIEQVLLNLVHNAAKFSPSSAPITVEVESSVQAGFNPNQAHVSVHVRDQGIGISADNLPMLFTKFTRLHTRGITQAQGTGLGLAICKGIIEAHGGSIWAESPGEGRGSTFSFTLPVAANVAAAPPPGGSPAEDGAASAETRGDRKNSILAVDDEPRILAVLKRGLGRAGYEVIGTTDPSEAVELARASRPDLLLLDIAMPGMSGFELLEQFRTISDVPVVFLTASHSEQDRERAMEMGARDYMTKPFSIHEVVSRIRSVLDSTASITGHRAGRT